MLLKDSPNNVALPGNLVDQVRISIRCTKVDFHRDNKRWNTNEHVPNRPAWPIWATRISKFFTNGGMAGGQVEKYKQIVISEVDLSLYKVSYALGKNHMANLKDENFFTLYDERSGLFDFPLPSFALKYREMQVMDSFDHGIHRIYLYEIMNEKSVQQSNTLAHIHQYYAQWRIGPGNSYSTIFPLK